MSRKAKLRIKYLCLCFSFMFRVVFLFSILGTPNCLILAKKTRLTWVNGIAYNLGHMEKEKGDISNYFGGKTVEYCHNPTSMTDTDDTWGYAADLTQATTQKFGRVTEEVNTLVKHLREAVSQVGENGKVIHIAHSQGALLTHLAAKQLSSLELNKIEVIAFGGAAALRKTRETPFGRVVNYYAVNDPLLLVVPSAAQALKSGFEDEEFCFLVPRLGNPIDDHHLLGPTYAQALAWEGKRFQNQYQSLFLRSTRPMYILIVALFQNFLSHFRALLKKVTKEILIPLLQTLLGIFHLLQRIGENLKDALRNFLVTPIVNFWLVFIGALYNIYRIIGREKEEYQPVEVALKLATKDDKDPGEKSL